MTTGALPKSFQPKRLYRQTQAQRGRKKRDWTSPIPLKALSAKSLGWVNRQGHAVHNAPHPLEGAPVVVLGSADCRVGEVNSALVVTVRHQNMHAGNNLVSVVVDRLIAPKSEPNKRRIAQIDLINQPGRITAAVI